MANRDLAFIGDVHLDHGDGHLEPFLAFLDRLADTCSTIVFIGDLFNVWLGDRAVERAHHTAVVERCAALRRRGVVVRYIEGNRDYRIGLGYGGIAFDDVTTGALTESCGGVRVWAVHGDLVNVSDRQYRAWRRFSRLGIAWTVFRAIPRCCRASLAESVEVRMRATNLDYKKEFPETLVRAHGATRLAAGFDAVVLGHFHVERELVEGAGRIFVLPDWRESHRWLRFAADGSIGFETA